MEISKLEQGKIYMVRHTGGKRAVRRVFKWTETRFKSIPCAVFTAKIDKAITASFDGENVTISAPCFKRFPFQEISIPEYDLISAIKV